jgi:hypothetical protein
VSQLSYAELVSGVELTRRYLAEILTMPSLFDSSLRDASLKRSHAADCACGRGSDDKCEQMLQRQASHDSMTGLGSNRENQRIGASGAATRRRRRIVDGRRCSICAWPACGWRDPCASAIDCRSICGLQ